MATSLSPSLNDGFDKAKERVRLIYLDYDYKISSNRYLNYTENDIEYDIRRLWSELPSRPPQPFRLAEESLVEMMGFFLLTRLYEGQDRFSSIELENSFGEILRKLWERFTGY